jgi:hypothetical protein
MFDVQPIGESQSIEAVRVRPAAEPQDALLPARRRVLVGFVDAIRAQSLLSHTGEAGFNRSQS